VELRERDGLAHSGTSLPLGLVTFNPFPLYSKGKSKPNPKQTVCLERAAAEHSGATAPAYLFAWSSALRQAQAVLLEPARRLRSDPSLSSWQAAAALLLVSLLPSPCIYIQPGPRRRSGGTRRGKVFPCAGTCSARKPSGLERSFSCCLLTSSLRTHLLHHFHIDIAIWLSTNLC